MGMTYCGTVNYAFMWVAASNNIQASIDSTNALIKITSSNKST